MASYATTTDGEYECEECGKAFIGESCPTCLIESLRARVAELEEALEKADRMRYWVEDGSVDAIDYDEARAAMEKG